MKTDLYWVETGTAGRLAIMVRPRAGDWLEDEMLGVRAAGVDVVVSLLTSEEVAELDLSAEPRACEAAGLKFRSLPIPDRDVPPEGGETLGFVRGLRDLILEGKSVVVHCRMGIGRSSLIAASTLKLLGVDAEEAFARLGAARGFSVPDTDEQRRWVLNFPA